jgi:hypothetical protein
MPMAMPSTVESCETYAGTLFKAMTSVSRRTPLEISVSFWLK